MVKSRTRSPRWKPGPPIHRSPEYHRQSQEYDHHRHLRRPIEWENERHRQNNSRNDTYNNFYDHMHEPSSFDFGFKRSEFDATNDIRRTYSPERQGESDRRFSAKYNDVMDYREHNRNFHDHRIHEKNIHNNNEQNKDFKAERRWGNFDRQHRERHRDWHDNDHWNEHDHPNQYSSPPRRSEDFVKRESFQKRYPDDDYREYEQPYKRAREAGQYDYQPSQRRSHWKDDHREAPYYGKDWTKEVDYRHTNPIHEKQSGHGAKIEYDYGHRSPSYVRTEHNLLDAHGICHSRHEERKLAHARTSQNHKTDGDGKERRRYKERSSEPLPKCNSRKDDCSNSLKNNANIRHLNHKHKDKGSKEEKFCRKTEDKSRKDSITTRHLSSQTPDPKVVLKISPVKKVVDNFGLKKSSDNSRPPQEHKNMSKDLPPKSEAIQGPRTSERKQVLGEDLKKRSHSNSKDRQTSEELVVAGKETFHPVFEHLPQSMHDGADKPSTEFNQELITIIHEVKANHFKSSGMSLHERFSKLHSENNKEELNLENSTLKSNPEIHRRIDMSLEELQKKSLHKTLDTQLVSHKLIEDPNDLRHDIERRRKKRLHSDQNGTTNANFANSDFPGSYCGLEKPEDEEGFSFSRERRSPFEEPTGRHPVRGSYYRRHSTQCYTSRSNFEETNETRMPYKGWGNSATRL